MNKYIEQAYYLGYQDGEHDGYHSSLIEEGRCDRKNSMDDLPNISLVSLDEVFEIIDKKHKEIYNHDFMTDSKTASSRIKLLEWLRKEVAALNVGEQE